MFQHASRILNPPIFRQPQSPYPLQRRFLLYGLATGVIASVVFSSALAGFSFLVLFGVVGALWRRDETPVLAFCLAYQWLAVTVGYLHQQIAGYYPGQSGTGNTGDIDQAVLLSQVGFIALAAGIRTGRSLVERRFSPAADRLKSLQSRYDVRLLFWVVIALYTINWFFEIDPMGIFFNAAQLIYRVIEFRLVLLFLLFLSILRQRKGYRYGIAAIAYVVIPSFASMMSAFSLIFILLFMALMTEWRPYSDSASERKRSARIIWWVSGNAVALVLMAIIWQGGIKPIWRPLSMSGQVQGSPLDKVSKFTAAAEEGISHLDWALASESLGGRLASGVFYFSYVVKRVPSVVPFENGTLTLRALQHTLIPRFLFPDKPNLGSDSWLIREYAGLYVAGEESETSVGLGYMGEFYIDFGVPGMFVPIFAFGLIVGLFYGALVLVSPDYLLYLSAATITMLFFMSYEGEIAKMFGGFVQSFIFTAAILYFGGRWAHRFLLLEEPAMKPGVIPPQVRRA